MSQIPTDKNHLPTVSTDTICAIGSGLSPAAIGILRLSGPKSFPILNSIFNPKSSSMTHRAMMVGTLHDNHQPLDEVCIVHYPAPHSYTSEDMAEIFCHGNPLLMKAILALLSKTGARLAEPGEFTKRAFLNDRLDLLQAEAVLDIIQAKTIHAIKNQQRILSGELSSPLTTLHSTLFRTLATLEASIEFPGVADSTLTLNEISSVIEKAQYDVQQLIKSFRTGQFAQNGATVLIAGKPNTGKSTLFNQLVGKNRAIVSDIPGTTRDYIQEDIQIDHLPIRLTDTAGLRPPSEMISGMIEKMGIELTQAILTSADLILWMIDLTEPYTSEETIFKAISDKPILIVGNKEDLTTAHPNPYSSLPHPFISISALNATGIDDLKTMIKESLIAEGLTDTHLFITNHRQFNLLTKTDSLLAKTLYGVQSKQPLDMIAEDLQQATQTLESIVGQRTSEDILSFIFSQFCIGK